MRYTSPIRQAARFALVACGSFTHQSFVLIIMSKGPDFTIGRLKVLSARNAWKRRFQLAARIIAKMLLKWSRASTNYLCLNMVTPPFELAPFRQFGEAFSGDLVG